MNKYKVIAPAGTDVSEVEFFGEQVKVGTEVELDEAKAAPLVTEGKLELVAENVTPATPATPPVGGTAPAAAEVPPTPPATPTAPAAPAKAVAEDDHSGGGWVGGHDASDQVA